MWPIVLQHAVGARYQVGLGLTYVLLPGYGQSGPFRKAAGYDVIVEAEAGLMHMWGYTSAPYPTLS